MMYYPSEGFRVRVWALLVGCLALFQALILLPTNVQAQVIAAQPDPTVCYAIADNSGMLPGGGTGNNQDQLVTINRTNANTTSIGATGTTNIESMTFVMGNGVNTLYAEDGGTLGTVNLTTAAFTAIGPAGTGRGSVGNVTFSDLDALAFDVARDTMYAAHRATGTNNNDLLLKVDRTTGAHIPDAFGPGVDYLVVTAPASQPTFRDIDDMAFDPVTGDLYATANRGGTGGLLVTVNTTTGAVTEVGTYVDTLHGGFVDDIEGISFYNNGTLYASTGNNGPDPMDLNTLFLIEKDTAATTEIGPFPNTFIDYEALGCLTSTTGIALKKFTNGEDADNPTGPQIQVGSPVTWTYYITNTGGVAVDNLTLADDKLGSITGACLEGPIPSIPVGGGFTCTVVGTATVVGQYANTGIVTGTATIPNGTVVLTDTDPSHYFGVGTPPPLGSIGDFVWQDTNGNGVQDVGEPGIPNVTVTLTNGNGAIQTDVTDANGIYGFINLLAGNYTVTVNPATLPAGLTQTFDLDGLATPNTATAPLAAGENRTDVDFGYQPTVQPLLGSIGDFVWQDTDGDGVQDAGEPGIANVTVTLTDSNGAIQTDVTDANGIYGFINLPAGAYTVAVDPVTLPAGLTPTFDLDGIATPNTTSAPLAAGENRIDVDFGYQPAVQPLLGSIGDFVWQDTDGDGVQDAGEPGIPNVTVILSNSSGVTQTAVTDANGIYGFSDLAAGVYTVTVSAGTLPGGLQQTFDLDGIVTANRATASLAEGQNRTDVDFGYRLATQLVGSIGNFVWSDTDSDGIQDPGEPGVEGVTVTLFDSNGAILQTVVTDGNGLYLFIGLPAGNYTVSFDLFGQAATLSPANQGADDTIDSDAGLDGRTGIITLQAGENDLTVDAGILSSTDLDPSPEPSALDQKIFLPLIQIRVN